MSCTPPFDVLAYYCRSGLSVEKRFFGNFFCMFTHALHVIFPSAMMRRPVPKTRGRVLARYEQKFKLKICFHLKSKTCFSKNIFISFFDHFSTLGPWEEFLVWEKLALTLLWPLVLRPWCVFRGPPGPNLPPGSVRRVFQNGAPKIS